MEAMRYFTLFQNFFQPDFQGFIGEKDNTLKRILPEESSPLFFSLDFPRPGRSHGVDAKPILREI